MWVHAECDNISNELFKVCLLFYRKIFVLCISEFILTFGRRRLTDVLLLKDLEHVDYYCPDCKLKFELEASLSLQIRQKFKPAVK